MVAGSQPRVGDRLKKTALDVINEVSFALDEIAESTSASLESAFKLLNTRRTAMLLLVIFTLLLGACLLKQTWSRIDAESASPVMGSEEAYE